MWAMESWRLHDTSPYCHALGIGLHLTLSQWLLWTQVSSKSWVLSITSQWDKKSQYSMTNTPSSPKVCSNGSSAASHSFVHSLDPSDHRPVHSFIPHGLRILRKRLPLNSTAFMTEYVCTVYYRLNAVSLTKTSWSAYTWRARSHFRRNSTRVDHERSNWTADLDSHEWGLHSRICPYRRYPVEFDREEKQIYKVSAWSWLVMRQHTSTIIDSEIPPVRSSMPSFA